MTKVEKHADYVLDHTDMVVMAYLEQGSDKLAICTYCDYHEFICAVASLIWDAHKENGVLLEKIREDLNKAVNFLTAEMYEESD